MNRRRWKRSVHFYLSKLICLISTQLLRSYNSNIRKYLKKFRNFGPWSTVTQFLSILCLFVFSKAFNTLFHHLLIFCSKRRIVNTFAVDIIGMLRNAFESYHQLDHEWHHVDTCLTVWLMIPLSIFYGSLSLALNPKTKQHLWFVKPLVMYVVPHLVMFHHHVLTLYTNVKIYR